MSLLHILHVVKQTLAAGSPNTPGVAAKLGEQSKRRKYNPIERVLPIALEAGGYLRQETKTLISAMCKNTRRCPSD
eukprot:3303950-Amphidinium_carterae.1